ncbi:phage head closure protein [Rhizobium oryzicola]|uniref:Phage head closure protein n=1 Tax=Rhizobium oryzicola TaxID=1232668 RepID=A0ABT8SU58_9HYPH|nr:phage head closure protein [Rhizobium oryzicola]MDO1581556.1 phage head closure protein [Rhizobium oryzicola]
MGTLILDPGALTARLTREAPLDAPDGQGGATLTWSEVGRHWARIEPVSQTPSELASADRVLLHHRVWLGKAEGITAGQRFRKGGRILTIKAVRDPDETGRYLVCDCEEEAQ